MQRSIEPVDDVTRDHNILSAFMKGNTFLCSPQQIVSEAGLDQAMLGSSFLRADALRKLCPACWAQQVRRDSVGDGPRARGLALRSSECCEYQVEHFSNIFDAQAIDG